MMDRGRHEQRRERLHGRALAYAPIASVGFLAGLLEYRARVMSHAKMSTFYPSSTQHTWSGGDGFYTGQADGVRSVDWFRNVLESASRRSTLGIASTPPA